MTPSNPIARHVAALVLPTLLVACGGSSDDATTTPPPVTPSSLAIHGTAAVGAALANASVQIACSAGSATLSAGADGSYSTSIAGGALPCVLTATGSDGTTVLHSVVGGSGHDDTTANITPLTELLLARYAGADPATFVAGFGAGTAISTADLATAQSALKQALAAAGLDTSAITDIIGGALTAGSGSYDGALDTLAATLSTAGTSLADLTTAVANTAQAGSDTSASTLTTLLAPASSDCAGLKTGPLRLVDFGDSSSQLVQVDAAAMTVTAEGVALPLVRNAACDYSIDTGDGVLRMLVLKSGLVTFTKGSGTDAAFLVGMPEQKLDVAALAGHYDRVQYGSVFDDQQGDFGTTTFDATGANAGLAYNCPLGYGNCVADGDTDKGGLVADADGGFDYVHGTDVLNRAFAFRNAAGRTLILATDSDANILVLASQDKLALPAVDRVAAYWQFTINASGLGATTEDANTITAADATSGVVSRSFASDGHVDTLTYNLPYDGLRYRAPNACTTSTGAASTCNGAIQLPFGGLVFAVSSVPAKHFMTVSVDKP